MQRRIEAPATWDSLSQLLAFADQIDCDLTLSEEQSYLLRLVIEEIATNIVKYSYDDAQPGVIQLACSYDDGTLRVSIRDHGHPFDPRAAPPPDFNDDVSARNVGGLGLFLVSALADDLSYQHDPVSGWNELLVVKG